MTLKNYDVVIARRAEKMLLTHTKFLAKVSTSAARRLFADFKKVTGLNIR